MSFNSETWEWFKTAPLPVVLSLCLTSFMVLGSYAYSLDKKQQEQKVTVEVAVAKAEQAEQSAERSENKLDKANEKLDKLLEAVLTIQAEAKAKKEKK